MINYSAQGAPHGSPKTASVTWVVCLQRLGFPTNLDLWEPSFLGGRTRKAIGTFGGRGASKVFVYRATLVDLHSNSKSCERRTAGPWWTAKLGRFHDCSCPEDAPSSVSTPKFILKSSCHKGSKWRSNQGAPRLTQRDQSLSSRRAPSGTGPRYRVATSSTTSISDLSSVQLPSTRRMGREG